MTIENERQNTRQQSDHFNIFYSSAVSGEISSLLGAPNYSYRFAERKFVSIIERKGHSAHNITMPEYYASEESLPPGMLIPNALSLHLIFRSTEQIRLLKFAWNVCCFAWEFDVLKDDTKLGEHPFLNQRRMLSLCDEVWVPCGYTKRVMQRYELKNTHIIPAPIETKADNKMGVYDALSYIGDVFAAPLYHNFLQSKEKNKEICLEYSSTLIELMALRLRENPSVRIYLTILNPEDFRKNLDAMLRAFHYFSKDREDVVLLVKVLTSASRFSLLDVMSDVIPNKLSSGTGIWNRNIVFFSDYLTEASMSCLYSMADFYLCASICEGQNLPLLEAMGHGVVPVTTGGTAMEDYITTRNSLVISDHVIPNDCEHLAGTIADRPFAIRRSYAEDIYSALLRSAALLPSDYQDMSERARIAVQEQFSEDVVWARIVERLQTIRSTALSKAEL